MSADNRVPQNFLVSPTAGKVVPTWVKIQINANASDFRSVQCYLDGVATRHVQRPLPAVERLFTERAIGPKG